MLNAVRLSACYPVAPREACITWAPAFDMAASEQGVDTPAELRLWLASMANESGQLTKFEEASYFNTPSGYIAGVFLHSPDPATLNEWKKLGPHGFDVRFFNAVYGPMMGNNGEGYKYRGLGPGQLTGHDNDAGVGPLIGADLERNPELMRDVPLVGARAFACYCRINHVLDEAADGTEAGALRALRLMNSGLRADVFQSHHLIRWHEVGLGLGIDNDGRDEMRLAQAALHIAGYDVGTRDGWIGPKTQSALAQFRRAPLGTFANLLDADSLGLLNRMVA